MKLVVLVIVKIWFLMKSVDKGVIFFNNVINDTHREKLYFIQFNWLAASDLFDIFTQSKFYYISHHHLLRVQMFEKYDSSNSKNEWLLLPTTVLQQSLGWFLPYHWKMLFLRGLILKPTERVLVLLKKG